MTNLTRADLERIVADEKADRRARQYASRKKAYETRYREELEKLIALAGGRCADCHNTYPSWVYDFHHRDPSTKLFQVNMRSMGTLWAKLVAEVEKCDLLCANCHRTRHHYDKSKD